MALSIGTVLGQYEIVSLLGKGGMGEVYRAKDGRLKRDVALKILPDEFARDAERIHRFQREAETLASLNHLNIGAIHDFQEAKETRFLVLELVEGETLAERLGRGVLPVDEALRIAKQICEALEAAHEKGIIHRDLKPANVKFTPDGIVKVLDFGLAKAMESSPSHGNMSNSPTMSMAATQAGVILGTAAYMSPEQARGSSADHRSDVFAFGCVLYEMIVRRQAFGGETVSDVLASVLAREPDFSAMPANLGPRIRDLLRRCLEKNPKQRWHAIADVRVEIESILTNLDSVIVDEPAIVRKLSLWKIAVSSLAAVILGSVVTGLLVWRVKPVAPSVLTRFEIALGEGLVFGATNRNPVAISPDGTQIVYTANAQLYLRRMSEIEAKPIAGLPLGVQQPAFSPDSREVAFYSTTELALKKVPVAGGPAITICSVTSNPDTVNWAGNSIVFGQAPNTILRVSSTGGKPEVIIQAADDELVYGPQVLPDGETILFSVTKRSAASPWATAQIVAKAPGKDRKVLVEGGADGRYVPSGHLLYAVSGTVFAVPFDARRLETTGAQIPVVEGVRRSNLLATPATQLSVSDTGTLVYRRGPLSASSSQSVLATANRDRVARSLGAASGNYFYPRLSPDGKRVAVGQDDGKEADIWVYDLSGTTAVRRLTFGGANRYPVWSADGKRVIFQSDREADAAIYWQLADSTGTAERLTKAEKGFSHIPQASSPDGQRLLFTQAGPGCALTGVFNFASNKPECTLWTMELKDRSVARFSDVQSPQRINAVFSPDGKRIAYESRHTGLEQIYVQPFPSTGSIYQLTKDKGHHPFWSRDGKELFYVPGPGLFSVINIVGQASFAFGAPVALPAGNVILNEQGPGFVRSIDIGPDSKQFFGVISSDVSPRNELQVVLNWFEELKQRVR